MIMLNQSTKRKQNYASWILTTLLLIFLLKIFFEDINNDVEDGLIHLIMIRMTKGHFKRA